MKNKLYITVTGFSLAILALLILVVAPLWLDVKNNAQKLSSEKNDIASFESQSNEIASFKSKYEQYQPNLEKLNQSFVDPQNPVDFIKFLEDTSEAQGVVPKISLAGASSASNNRFITLKLFASGDFSKIVHLTQAIEYGPYLLQITNITADTASNQNSTSKSATGSGQADVTLTINAFTK